MKLPAQCFVLGFAALLCFLDSFLAPKGNDPGPALTAVMGILLVRRAVIITHQSAVVIFAGCVLAGVAVAGQPRFRKHRQTDLDRDDSHRGNMLCPLGKTGETLGIEA
jgi:hypothetical protein